jgi:hypothetical protein
MAKSEKPIYRALKSICKNDESVALQKACEKLQTTSRFLKAKHTDKMFVFEKIR